MIPRRLLPVAAVALLAVGPLAACSDDGPAKGEAILKVDGIALVVRQGGDKEEVTRRTDVRSGDVVTVVTGSGTLNLGDGASLTLREGLGDHADTKVVMGPIPSLQAGDLLATTNDEMGLSVDGTRLRIIAGSVRASRSTGMVIAAYDGDVELDSAGQKRTVPALREMSVPALGRPPAVPRPFDYDASDPWDRRFLGEAIDLGQRLQSLAEGYTQNLPASTSTDADFFRTVLPGLADEEDFGPGVLDGNRTAGETLIGASIVDLGRRGTFVERWLSVFAFRDAGAAWGLVALDQGVDGTPVLQSITEAIDESPLTVNPRQGSARSTTTSSTVAPARPQPPPPTTPTTAPSPKPTFPPTTVPALPLPSKPGGDGLLSPVVDPVAGLLSGLLGGLIGGG